MSDGHDPDRGKGIPSTLRAVDSDMMNEKKNTFQSLEVARRVAQPLALAAM